jgi:hypothetical protein
MLRIEIAFSCGARLATSRPLGTSITKSTDGLIGTLHHYDRNKIVIDRAGKIAVEGGITPSIIHQYDRFPELAEHVARTYGRS